MSRLEKKPILLPKGVEVKVVGSVVEVKGPKGNLSQEVPSGIKVVIEEAQIFVSKEENAKLNKPEIGLYRALIQSNIIGVSQGYEKKLQLIGVGYRANLKGANLDLQIGLSHPCEIPVPSDIQVKVDKSTLITITGIDKRLVGHFAATVRSKKPPEPYKGKGIRYVDEYVRKKAGKAAKGK